MNLKSLFLSVGCVILMCLSVFAQEQAVIWTPFPSSLTVSSEGKDDRGTDVMDIYNIKLDFAHKKYANNNFYTIVYFEDDRPIEEFKDQHLPYTLTRNYKGLLAGKHEIRMDVEDGKGNVLSTVKANIHVSIRKKNK